MTSFIFISDLHLYCRRFQGEPYWDELRSRCRKPVTVLLGGDIFDFRWTTLPSIDATIRAAGDRVEELVSEAPHCRFYYLPGNHDCHATFIDRLGQLQDQYDWFSWEPSHVRLGTTAFLHGDVPIGGGSADALARYRRRWGRKQKKGTAANAVYDVAVRYYLHCFVGKLCHPPRWICSRILSYLAKVDGVDKTPVTDVYFGHTHVPLKAHRHGDVRFHNGGAPIRGCTYQMLEGTVSG